jgi:hypothetical protein
MPKLSAGRPLLFADDNRAISCNETRLRQQAFKLAAQQRSRRIFIKEDRKLQAR